MLVSVVAGVTTSFYESRLPAGSPVVRVMPNAPALVGAGVSALAKGRFVTDEQLAVVARLFECLGGVLTVPEAQIDSVSLGEEKPRCSDSNDQCYAQNRRGDILYDREF